MTYYWIPEPQADDQIDRLKTAFRFDWSLRLFALDAWDGRGDLPDLLRPPIMEERSA